MPNNIPPRYLPSYRECEVKFICDQAKGGESLCLIGVAGSGKSNLTKFLRDETKAKRQYLGDETETIHFLAVDATGWDGKPESLWELMVNALVSVTTYLPAPQTPIYSDKPLQQLETWLQWVCQQQQHKVMFMLDEFDDVLRIGPRSVFDQFSRLRSAGNRERLSYLLFTRKLPHVLGRQHDLDTQSKFYDLFRNHIYALPLLKGDDSWQMLRHLNARTGYPLDRMDLVHIRSLTGGHSRLIKITFEVWQREKPSEGGEITTVLAAQPEIQDECNRILQGLHRQEREVAIRFARNQAYISDEPTLKHLQRRELIGPTGIWFSPFMEIYIRDYLG